MPGDAGNGSDVDAAKRHVVNGESKSLYWWMYVILVSV